MALGPAIVIGVGASFNPLAAAGLIVLVVAGILGLLYPFQTLVVGGFLHLGFLVSGSRIAFLANVSLDGLMGLVLLSVGGMAIAREPASLRYLREVWPATLFGALACVSVLWASARGLALRDASHYLYPLVMYAVARAHLRTRADVKDALKLLGRVAVIAIGLTLVTRAALGSSSLDAWSGVTRFNDSPQTYDLSIGQTVLMATAALAVLRTRGWRPRTRVMAGIVLAVAAGLITLTVARAYVFGLLSALVLVSVLPLTSRSTSARLSTIPRVVLAATVAFALGFGVLTTENAISRRMFWQPERVTSADILASPAMLLDPEVVVTSGRSNIWAPTIDAVQNNAMLGGGAGSTRAFFEKQPFGPAFQTMHGDYARVYAELGLIGVSLLVWLWGWLLTTGLRGLQGDRRTVLGVLAAAALVGGAVFGIVASLAYDVTAAIFGFLEYLLLAVALIRVDASRADPVGHLQDLDADRAFAVHA